MAGFFSEHRIMWYFCRAGRLTHFSKSEETVMLNLFKDLEGLDFQLSGLS